MVGEIFAIVALIGVLLAYNYKMKPRQIQQTKPVVMVQETMIDKINVQNQPTMLIMYGSQTGTAEAYAIRLLKHGVVSGVKCYNLDAAVPVQLDEINVPVVFVMATYGTGEPTDNARDFMESLYEYSQLSNVKYAIWGLGNSSYEHFNQVARDLDKKLKQLGAIQLAYGESDEHLDKGDDGKFVSWYQRLFKLSLWSDEFPEFSFGSTGSDVLVRSYSYKVVKTDRFYTGEHGTISAWNGLQKRITHDQKNPYYASIKECRMLSSDPTHEVLHLDLNLPVQGIRYQAGDHVGVYGQNEDEEVVKLAAVLQLKLDSVIDMRSLDVTTRKTLFPSPCTVKAALQYYLDINFRVNANVLQVLANYAQNDSEKHHLTSVDHQEYIVKAGRNLRQVLEEHPSILIEPFENKSQWTDEQVKANKQDISSCGLELSHVLTVGDVLEMFPRLQPRYYSISSSPKHEKSVLSITAAVVKYVTPSGRNVRGVCTGWFATMQDSDLVPIYIRQSSFRLPKNSMTPIICIGPGTGLAPFRGFIQERSVMAVTKISEFTIKNPDHMEQSLQLVKDTTGRLDMIKQSKLIGDTMLFFGCRNRNTDFLYAKELQDFEALTHLICAFSRESDHKIYVQDRLLEYGEYVWKTLQKPYSCIYVCGDASNMARDVQQTLISICKVYGKLSQDDASVYIKSLREQNRYVEDVWS